jgi:hypothetical protein
MEGLDNLKSDSNYVNLNNNRHKELKTIILIVVFVMIMFLLAFIYNLIKCYLPKYQKKKTYLNGDKKIELAESN